jgi:NTE family protein
VISALALAIASSPALTSQSISAGADAVAATAPAPKARPRIGLVLGGGGAKGGAHIGVLSVLDEMRIPVDCVIGTSVGALVGGAYASGMTASEVEGAILRIPWRETIAFQSWREQLPMRRKVSADIYSNRLEFGVRDGKLVAPSGFINTQHVEQTINSLVSRSLGERDFSKLPIPFRAIATDMQKGEMVVLAEGDLPRAMRASMAVPGVFAPVTIDGRVLGDGGLTRNVPVDIAREMCADVVIAVALPNPIPDPQELQSPLTMLSRTLDVLVGANERQQLETLRPDDVAIVVPMENVTSLSFDRIGDAIPIGRAAALAHRAELARYSVSEAEYTAWRDATTRDERRSVRLADISVRGLDRVDERFVRARLGLGPGDIVDQRLLGDRINRLFAADEFESIHYALNGDVARPLLDLTVHEKSWGPNIVRFDLGLQMGSDSNTAFVLGGDYLRTWINPAGGEIHGSVTIGRTSAVRLSLYQPFSATSAGFVEPGITLRRSQEDFFIDGETAARYDLDTAVGYIDIGRSFGTQAEVRAGLVSGVKGATRDIASTELPEINTQGYGGWTIGATHDSRDQPELPTHGWLGRLRYFHADDRFGSQADEDYQKLEGLLAITIPVWSNVLYLRTTGGASFGTTLPIYDKFVLGGPMSFPGLSLGELRGESYWTVQGAYMHNIAEISSLFGHALYLGFALTAGNMDGRLDQVQSEPLYSGTLLLAGRTPLGPLRLGVAVASTDNWQVVLGIGRPIEESTITDPVW